MNFLKKIINYFPWLSTEDGKLFSKLFGLVVLYESLILWAIFLFRYFNSKLLLKQIFINPYYFLIRWDSLHYLKIVESGYDKISMEFFPLYPVLIRIGGVILFNSYILAGFLISWACIILTLFYFYKLLIINGYTNKVAERSLLLFLFSPFAIFFSTIYTESLFIFLAVAFFYYLIKEKWLVAAIFGGLAMITRNVGIFLSVVYLVKYFQVYRFKFNKKLLNLLIMFSGLAVFCWYGYYKFDDWLAFMSAQKYWSQWRIFVWPWQHHDLINLFSGYVGSFTLYNVFGAAGIEFGSFILSLVAGIYFLMKKKILFGIYCLLNTLLFLTFSTYYSVNRFIIVIFPIYLFFSQITEKHKITFYYLLALSFIFYIFNIFIFSGGGWLG
jgi:Gpi18-like mannosyltransferase